MPVFDQYEVESSSTYSGSFSDQVMFGELFVNAETLVTGYTPLGDPNPQTSRRSITSRIAGRESTSPNINNMWMPGYIIDGYASGSWLGRQQRFQSIFSDETWLDSYMPNLVDIALINGSDLIGIRDNNAESDPSGSAFGIDPLPRTPNYEIGFGYEIWSYTYPFQSRYKRIHRLFKLSKVLPSTYTVTKDENGNPISFTTNKLARIYSSYVDSAGDQQLHVLSGYMNIPTGIWPPPAVGPQSLMYGTPDIYSTYKQYFGIGKGGYNPIRSTNYYDGPEFKFSRSLGPSRTAGYNVIPRGFKYGIRTVAPEQTKCVYRLGRYGQFRDTLEGRPTVATYVTDTINTITNVKIKRTFFYPIEINFVSGSKIYTDAIDYVTATNPDYNPYDSGIYDKYYRSGQPYFDRDNED
jgi:hypothetical protein